MSIYINKYISLFFESRFIPLSQSDLKKLKISNPVFDAVPSRIVFRQWEVGKVYETMLDIRNIDSVSRQGPILKQPNLLNIT